MSLQNMINESLKNQGAEQETPKTNPEAEKDVEKNEKPAETEEKDVEKNEKPAETEEKDVEKPKKSKKFEPSRGFKTLKEAEEFVESEAFNKWDNASKKEFKNWLKKIKED